MPLVNVVPHVVLHQKIHLLESVYFFGRWKGLWAPCGCRSLIKLLKRLKLSDLFFKKLILEKILLHGLLTKVLEKAENFSQKEEDFDLVSYSVLEKSFAHCAAAHTKVALNSADSEIGPCFSITIPDDFFLQCLKASPYFFWKKTSFLKKLELIPHICYHFLSSAKFHY